MTADRKRSAVRHFTRTLRVSERRSCTVLGYARDVANALERLMTLYGAPKHLRSDIGPEFLAKTMRPFLHGMGVETILIEPGAPSQNPFAETFHARL